MLNRQRHHCMSKLLQEQLWCEKTSALHLVLKSKTGTMKKVLLILVTLAYLELPVKVGSASICSHGPAGCHVASLADLFDRVILQSSRMHDISSDLHSELERYFFPTKNVIAKWKCHTHGIITPADKENAQRLGRDQLTEVIRRLLEAWVDPLSQLHHSMSQDLNQDLDHYSFNKALEISDIVHELRVGVEKMTEKMKLLGMLDDIVGYVTPETLPSFAALSFYKKGKLNSMDHHALLYCFHRDSNKIKSYLRVLKCTSLPDC